MRCPKCRQVFAHESPEGGCPLCGAQVGPVRQEVLEVYLVTGGLFLAVLVYVGLVVFWERTGHKPPVAVPPAVRYILLGAAAAMFVPMLALERSCLAKSTPQGVRTAALMLGVLSESTAILGLLLYFLGSGVQCFALCVGISLAGFAYLGSRMPTYVRLLEEGAASNP